MNRLASAEILLDPHEQEHPEQRFFRESLDLIRKSHVYIMPDLSPHLNHEGRTTEFPTDTVTPGLYLSTGYFAPTMDHGAPDRITFQPQELLKLGREDSQHNVFFGLSTASWFKRGESISSQIAVKPQRSKYSNDTNKSLHEIAMHQYMEQLGIPTLKVLGMLVVDRSGNGPEVFSITQFNPTTTMDNINWRSLSMEQRWARVGIALDALAILHSNLIFYGDAEFKNIAFSQTKGQSVMIDTESSESALYLAHPTSGLGTERIRQCMSNDFSRLAKSIDEFVFKLVPVSERPSSIQRFEKHIEQVFIPYYERLAKIGSPYLAVLKKQLEKVIERKMLEATGEA